MNQVHETLKHATIQKKCTSNVRFKDIERHRASILITRRDIAISTVDL